MQFSKYAVCLVTLGGLTLKIIFELNELLPVMNLLNILYLGKRKSGQVEDGLPDPNHPPVPTAGFAKYVGKLHKSDDRGFMIQYNVRMLL